MLSAWSVSSSTMNILIVLSRFLGSAFSGRHLLLDAQRQLDDDAGAAADLAVDADVALVLRDDLLDRREAEAGAEALGAEQRLEDPPEIFRRNSRPGVLDGQREHAGALLG